MGIAILFFTASLNFSSSLSQYVGPETFPQILSVLLVISCLISIIKTRRQSDQHIDLPNLRYIGYTIGFIFLFILAWIYIGLFYIVSVLFISILAYVYNPAQHSFKKVGGSLAFSLILTFFVYLVFDQLLKISL
ncbi:tripartite tricarboxylate transporter TctB family protein [Ammoniphilus sp. 3BR4]|uniref:tripartite tricarboxylate transporter TctB family protein n=1 Tax=Ammoniphilus sp. 3BR4 TaxID=3158265 RepID=UPI0034657CF2